MTVTTQKALPSDFFTQDSTLGVRNPLWGRTRTRTRITLEHYEDALRLGARYTNEDLADLVATARPSILVDIRHVSTRLADAGDFVAKAYGVKRAVVEREFEAAQEHFGVRKRKDLLAAARRSQRRKSSGSPGDHSSGSVATVPTEDVTEDSDEMETVELMRVERAASILAGLSRRAWEEEISVEECEEMMKEREDGFG